MQEIDKRVVKELVYRVDNKYIMLDIDLECDSLFGKYDFRDIVNKNYDNFYKKGYCWRLNKREIEQIISQSREPRASIPAQIFMNAFHPIAFTEEGILALTDFIDSEIADDIFLNIVKAIIEVRMNNRKKMQKNVKQPYINNNYDEDLIKILDKLIEQNKKIIENDTKFGYLFMILMEPENSEIFFD